MLSMDPETEITPARFRIGSADSEQQDANNAQGKSGGEGLAVSDGDSGTDASAAAGRMSGARSRAGERGARLAVIAEIVWAS
jgi:hypothetical protein